jgi:hypothetical protein
MNCSRNDVVLLPIPFTDFPNKEWRAAGLNVPSGVKAQLATVEEKLVVKIVGKLSAADGQSLNE